MWPVSDEFKAALKRSHHMISKAEVLRDNQVIATLPITSGTVNADKSSLNRRRCDIKIGGTEYVPGSSVDLLHPLSGNELKLYRGIRKYHDVRPYAGEVLRDKPVGYWRLGEKEGTTAYDSSGNGRNGTYRNNPTLGRPGAIVDDHNTSIELNGVDEDILLPSSLTSPLVVANAAAAEGWVKLDAYPTNSVVPTIISEAYAGDVRVTFALAATDSDKRPWVGFFDGTWRRVYGPAESVPLGEWAYVAGTFDGTTLRLYVNAVEIASITTTAAIPKGTGTEPWYIGRRWDMPHYHDGGIDEVALYDKALSADDIKRHYEVGRKTRALYEDEYVPLGVFGIEDSDVVDTGDSIEVSVKGFDRSKRVQRARFTDLYFIAQGTNYATAIRDLIENRLPGTTFSFMTTDMTTPPMVFGYGGWSGGGDPWEYAVKMATAIGAELYFNANGVCVLRAEPDPASAPISWEYVEGSEALVLHLDKGMTREGVYNQVIAYGLNTNTGEPIRVVAQDDDPNSPTYVGGSFGTVPTFYRSTMLLTQEQAQEAAEAHLRKVLGTPEQVRLTTVPNPAHEVGDVIVVSRSRAKIHLERHIIEKLNIPMTYSQTISMTCRKRQV